MTLQLEIKPDAKELIMQKADGNFTLDMHETLSYTGHGHIEPEVKLGKPKDHSYLYEPVEMDGLTCFMNLKHCFSDECVVMLKKFLKYRCIGIEPKSDEQ